MTFVLIHSGYNINLNDSHNEYDTVEERYQKIKFEVIDEDVSGTFDLQGIVETTMGEVSTREKTEALHAFMKTLAPAPALRKSLTELERAKGMSIFEKMRCDECHSPPHFTDRLCTDTKIGS